MPYHDLLIQFNVSSLESRRCVARLTILYKITHNLCFFPVHVFNYLSSSRHHNLHNLTLSSPFTRTNSFTYSFVPFTINLWNKLDSVTVHSPSVKSFKYLVQRHYTLY